MHPASLSIKVFGIYVVFTGVVLFLSPGLLFEPLGLPRPTEIWVRALGALAIVLGYYYWACGSAGAVAFFRATVAGRVLFFGLSTALVVVFDAPLQLLLFGAIDLVGAAWTWQSLRGSRDA